MKSVVLIPTKRAADKYPEHFTIGKRYEGTYLITTPDGKKRYKYLTNNGTDLYINEDDTSPYVTFTHNRSVIGGKLL